MGRSVLIILKLSFRKRDEAGHSSLVDQQRHVKKPKYIGTAFRTKSVQNRTDTENRSRYKHAKAGAPMVS
jgi:hypothetical protein